MHHLAINSPLPAKDVCVNSIRTKHLSNIVSKKVLIFTSHDVNPEEVKNGVRCKRVDLVTHYVEADYIILHQVESAIRNGMRPVKVISADTDAFVLLSYHFVNRNWTDAESLFCLQKNNQD